MCKECYKSIDFSGETTFEKPFLPKPTSFVCQLTVCVSNNVCTRTNRQHASALIPLRSGVLLYQPPRVFFRQSAQLSTHRRRRRPKQQAKPFFHQSGLTHFRLADWLERYFFFGLLSTEREKFIPQGGHLSFDPLSAPHQLPFMPCSRLSTGESVITAAATTIII